MNWLKEILRKTFKENLKRDLYILVLALLAIVIFHYGSQAYDYFFNENEHKEVKRIRTLFEPELSLKWEPCNELEGYCGIGNIDFRSTANKSATDVISYVMIGEKRVLDAVYLIHTSRANSETFDSAREKYKEYLSKLFLDVLQTTVPKEIVKPLSYNREEWNFFLLYLRANGNYSHYFFDGDINNRHIRFWVAFEEEDRTIPYTLFFEIT